MTRQALIDLIFERRSYLCVGLDSDPAKLPRHLLHYDDPVYEFNRQIIDATRDLAVAYKPNLAFYEAQGTRGWAALEKTVRYIGDRHFKIADAKRGDIGNTSRLYAKAFFETLPFDAVTIAPYMGEDSVAPFLGFEGKWAILLGLTSNAGSRDFQLLESRAGGFFYESVLKKSKDWGRADQLMFVIGATHPELMRHVRSLAPEYFFLVPGVGAQGGDLGEISTAGLTSDCGLLVNASRSIIFASSEEDFAEAARAEAQKLQLEMAGHLVRLKNG
jgi:orotidine-5'-phosphate decarboxylase